MTLWQLNDIVLCTGSNIRSIYYEPRA